MVKYQQHIFSRHIIHIPSTAIRLVILLITIATSHLLKRLPPEVENRLRTYCGKVFNGDPITGRFFGSALINGEVIIGGVSTGTCGGAPRAPSTGTVGNGDAPSTGDFSSGTASPGFLSSAVT